MKPGRCPGPRGLTLLFRKGQLHRKEKRQRPRHCPLQTRYGAHVAPQRCTIPRTGKAIPLYHICKKNASTKNQVVRNIGYILGVLVRNRNFFPSTKVPNLDFHSPTARKSVNEVRFRCDHTLDCKENRSSLVLFSSQVIIYHTFPEKSIDVTHTLYFTSVLHLFFRICRNLKHSGDNFEKTA